MKKKLSLSLLIVPFLAWAADADPGLKVLSLNFDTNAAVEEGMRREAFPELRVDARMPHIVEGLGGILDKENPDFVNLQEGRDFVTKQGDRVNSISPLVALLKGRGYDTRVSGYNPTGKSFSYIVGIKNGKFDIDSTQSKYFTKTPDAPTDHTDHDVRKEEIKDHNFGEEWERSTYITKLHDKSGQTYYVFNVHLGIGKKHRLKASEQLKGLAKEIIEKDPNAKIIMTGDFNTFPDWGGPEQLEIMKTDSPLIEATEDLRLPNGKKVDSSFVAFPHDMGAASSQLKDEFPKLYDMEPQERREGFLDLFENKATALGGHLDRVLDNIGGGKATLIPMPRKKFKEFKMDEFDEEHLKAGILKYIDAFSTDHQPVLVEY